MTSLAMIQGCPKKPHLGLQLNGHESLQLDSRKVILAMSPGPANYAYNGLNYIWASNRESRHIPYKIF